MLIVFWYNVFILKCCLKIGCGILFLWNLGMLICLIIFLNVWFNVLFIFFVGIVIVNKFLLFFFFF